MTDYDPRDEESPVVSGPAPTPEPDNPLVPVSLVTTLTKAEIDQQIDTARAHPRSYALARDGMITLATMDEQMAEECVYSVPRAGKMIRGPSIRFAEIVLACWQNVRCAARVTHEDVIAPYVEAEAIVHDLQTNFVYVARARRPIQFKKGRRTVDRDMTQLAGAAAISVARRNAILGAVPKPVWRKALEEVERVIRKDQRPLVERRDVAISYFNKLGLPTERILRTLELQHLDDFTVEHLVDLNGMREALKTGESTLDQLFPEERPPGPKPETLKDKLEVLSGFNPETGEIKESGLAPLATPDGAGATSPPQRTVAPVSSPEPEIVKVSQRGPRGARRNPIQERLQAEGDAAAAKGMRALSEWQDTLTRDDLAHISVQMDRTWQETAAKVA